MTTATPLYVQHPILVIMGVSGCGKTTVGRAIAARLELPFIEGDDFHPPANIAKMSAGIPLDDADRWPWLEAVSERMREVARHEGGVVAGCSALKRKYRDFIRHETRMATLFVALDGDRETLYARMQSRDGHYMPATLLDSQLADYERPDADEPTLTFSLTLPFAELVDDIHSALNAGERL